MRVSKLEPHVQGGPPLDDLDHVIEAIGHESEQVHDTVGIGEQTAESSLEKQPDLKSAFVRYVDFLREKGSLSRNSRSKKAVAFRKYHFQAALFQDINHQQTSYERCG